MEHEQSTISEFQVKMHKVMIIEQENRRTGEQHEMFIFVALCDKNENTCINYYNATNLQIVMGYSVGKHCEFEILL